MAPERLWPDGVREIAGLSFGFANCSAEIIRKKLDYCYKISFISLAINYF